MSGDVFENLVFGGTLQTGGAAGDGFTAAKFVHTALMIAPRGR